jgi:cation diffusion facilitator CzcD-associated flavoprotein CzcO
MAATVSVEVRAGVVAIIGGGISGLCMAKYCASVGLIPHVLEREAAVGGLWRQHGNTWSSMKTNVSIHALTSLHAPLLIPDNLAVQVDMLLL